MPIIIQSEPFDPWGILSRFESEHSWPQGKLGAASVFVGTMRDFNLGDEVTSMQLQHYPGMTERELELICQEAGDRWPLLETLIVHRHGILLPGESIMLVAAWSSHRAEAFDGCRYMVEALKSRAPFWKKEILQDSERWLDAQKPESDA